MSLIFWFYVGVPALTIAINALLVYWIYTRHLTVRGANWYLLGLGLVTGWMALEIVHLVLSDPGLKFLARAFATKVAVWSFLAVTVFYSVYSRSDFHRHPLAKAAYGVTIAVTLLPTWVEPYRSFIYADSGVASGPVPYVFVEPGLGYAVTGSLVAVLTAYGLYHIVRYLLSTPRRSGLQLTLLVVGALSIMIAIALGNLNVFPLSDKTHADFGALPNSVLIALAVFRFRLFEMQPVARNAVVEELRDPVLVLDRDHRLVDFNPASAAVWPAIEDALGESIEAAAPAVAAELSDREDPTRAASQFSLVVDGTRRHYSLNVSTVREGDAGEVDLYAVLLRDVTDLEQSRWQLARQNERLDQVAATISHDLRNPISVADGFSEMLDELLAAGDLDPEDLETARDHLVRARRAHGRMGEIIDDVLTIAREGKSVEETESLRLAGLAHEAWEQVDTADATLTIADDRILEADRSKLQTLLENLFRNAVEHAGRDVEVTVGPRPDGFSVSDDGPGIPPEDADEVFEYGYTTDEEGTGLGLSIVRTIAESHGWTVAVDREYPGGTRFVFRNVASERAPDGEGDRAPRASTEPGRNPSA